ncbi:uncharacterized protein LOC126672367 [Mercurialis annua]|uniref:uncharacterized protein LOC126672367 n=1 Tax=Mercurialis annua TaxID=3986 RepID=UPI00215E5310|nr:uncharacterized protein LOC126672367 [Mercurialis annua]
MSCLAWNFRGMASPRAIRFLKEMVKHKNQAMLFLCETLVTPVRIGALKSALKFESMFCVDSVGRKGGLAMFWKGDMNVVINGASNNYIDAEVVEADGRRRKVTRFYGCPERSRRRESWKIIRRLNAENNVPWCILGDFKDMLDNEEKRGGEPQLNWLLTGFRLVIIDCGLVDIGAKCYQYTWSRGRGDGGRVEERLDRAFCSETWLQLFPESVMWNLESTSSDHLPVLISRRDDDNVVYDRSFKFNNVWVEKNGCKEVVKEVWGAERGRDIVEKLKCSKVALEAWGKS